ncbi:hypothetical protein F53441_2206 [Fusarium austroafricanum]|uniref:Uncharacterized protein n=1 Tax=Fusarium austroafricanum TaxID=2364996 RepID=A0A8H4PC82_9HYPO|nr:hypothetical protein F53441_2206 [Fusarium austroafricanum]
MPFVGEDAHAGRKRRWSDDDERSDFSFRPSEEAKDFYILNQRPESAPRKVLPLSKRARITDDGIHVTDDVNASNYPFNASHRRRRSSQHKTLQVQPAFAKPRAMSALLAPCHICHRRPTKKSDLDSFADCQGCGERTCFVCIRECHGWNLDGGSGVSEQEVLSRSFHMDDVDDAQQDKYAKSGTQQTKEGWNAIGHQVMVCSRCCIERGTKGDVTCLGCFFRMEGS